MSNFNNTSISEIRINLATNPIPVTFRFWTYLILDILSIACSFFVLYYLLFDRTLRRALNNHVIIVLLFVGLISELTSVPWILYRYHFGVPLIQRPIFYLFSFFFDYAFYTIQVMLFAWATIERHILIFKSQWMSTKIKRFFFHYLPIILILIYCLIYYSIITFGSFCKNSFVSFLAGGYIIPCIYGNVMLAAWELFIHQVTSTLVIVIFSITLMVRVVRQKRKLNQPIQWRKYRMMAIQLLSISALYLIFNSPWILILLATLYGISAKVARIYTFYGIYIRTYVMFLLPFVCCGLGVAHLR